MPWFHLSDSELPLLMSQFLHNHMFSCWYNTVHIKIDTEESLAIEMYVFVQIVTFKTL